MFRQVPLVAHPSLGQESDIRAVAANMAAAQEQELSKLLASINAIPEAERAGFQTDAQSCGALISDVRNASDDGDLRTKAMAANYCLQRVKGTVDSRLSQLKSQPGTASPAAAPAPYATAPASGAPTWAYVIGGLALVGLVAFVATRG